MKKSDKLGAGETLETERVIVRRPQLSAYGERHVPSIWTEFNFPLHLKIEISDHCFKRKQRSHILKLKVYPSRDSKFSSCYMTSSSNMAVNVRIELWMDSSVTIWYIWYRYVTVLKYLRMIQDFQSGLMCIICWLKQY